MWCIGKQYGENLGLVAAVQIEYNFNWETSRFRRSLHFKDITMPAREGFLTAKPCLRS